MRYVARCQLKRGTTCHTTSTAVVLLLTTSNRDMEHVPYVSGQQGSCKGLIF